MANYKPVDGAPDDYGGPKFLTMSHNFNTSYLPTLVEELNAELAKVPTVLAIKGLDDIIVTDEQRKELLEKGVGIGALNLKQMVKVPEPIQAKSIIQRYLAIVSGEVPLDYRKAAEDAVLARMPRYASSLTQAETALVSQVLTSPGQAKPTA